MAREGGIMAWQWSNYDRNHRDVGNLLLHFVAVPAFIAGAMATVTLSYHRQWFAAGIAFALMVAAFAVQGLGHKREAEAPIPFDGPGDFLARVFIEQFITFPRFVLSGGFARSLRTRD
jgi:uncharacterized membrane protein YGL010W